MLHRILIIFFIFLLSLPASGQIKRAEKIYKKVNDAVVRIYTYHDDKTMHGQGSGVIIKDKGWIVTNSHVVGDAKAIFAEHEGNYIALDSIVAVDTEKDILILQLLTSDDLTLFNNIPKIRVGNSDNLRVGQKIYAIGSPFGFENTITEGIISGLRSSPDSTQKYMQISAPISKGSSGGAIVNAKGELIGISTMVLSDKTAQNINFAILINDVIDASKNIPAPNASKGKEHVKFYYQKGLKEYLSGNYYTAINYYEKALKISNAKDKATLYYSIAVTYRQLEILDSAIAYYHRSLDLSERADAYTGLGDMYLLKKDHKSSISYYNKAIKTDPKYYEAYLGLSMLYFSIGDMTKSLANLKKIMGLEVRNSQAYLLMGYIAFKAERYENAIYFYKAAIGVNVKFAEAYLALSTAYIKTGEMEKAMVNQQKAYALKPSLRNIK
jgi:Tfp pilus assembly protein PilF